MENIKNKKKKDDRFIFPEWMNYLPMVAAISAVTLLSGIVFSFWYWFNNNNFDVGHQPKQPIPYSHRLHAGDLGIDCRYCHTQVDKGPHATLPPTETCMNCHKTIKTNSPHIIKLKESFVNNKPIKWVRVHHLPDYAYFDHSRHVNSGVSCVECHGRVDQMNVVRQVKSLSMSFCLDCHRSPESKLRPLDKVTDLSWTPKEDDPDMGKRLRALYHINPREDCNTCHR